MTKVVAIVGPPERWLPLCKEHRQLAEFVCVSPVKAAPKDDASFSLFLVELFSGKYDVMVATCPTAIEAMVGMAKGRKMLDRLKDASKRTEFIVIGDRTEFCATQYGFHVSSVAPEATTDALIKHLNGPARRGSMALLRSDHGSPTLLKDLRASGWKVDEVQVYSLLLDDSEEMEALLDRLEDGEIDVLVFPTPAHVKAFLLQMQERCGKEGTLNIMEGLTVAAMGKESKESLEEYGVQVALVPERAEPSELIKQVIRQLDV
jgi:uroporphyrinogen-III synthase